SVSPDSDQYRAELAGADVVVVTAGRTGAAALGVDPQLLLRRGVRGLAVVLGGGDEDEFGVGCCRGVGEPA
ncbi:hypothetical protein, partial [Mycobacterium kiyosense]|uniref:hypothetical protein n=1 Tax=Mycobacterium kiyosense TaxID=2871094 RepID=UPI0022324309